MRINALIASAQCSLFIPSVIENITQRSAADSRKYLSVCAGLNALNGLHALLVIPKLKGSGGRMMEYLAYSNVLSLTASIYYYCTKPTVIEPKYLIFGAAVNSSLLGLSLYFMPKLNRIDDQRQIVENEIVELHRFFVPWFRGSTPQSDKADAFRAFESHFHPQFEMDAPFQSGLDYDAVMEMIGGLFGSEKDTGFDIEIKNVKLVFDERTISDKLSVDMAECGDECIIAQYEEWQMQSDSTKNTVRQSYVLFEAENNGKSPHGILWRKLHEEWKNEN